MGSFKSGFLSGMALSGVFSALYVGYSQRQQQKSNKRFSPVCVHAYQNQQHALHLHESQDDSHLSFEFQEKRKLVETESYFHRGSEILKHGVPNMGSGVRFYANHVLQYDQARKIPLWVAEHMTQNHVKGTANRKHSKFKPDPDIPPVYSATNNDYWNSGWSRGHMAPAGDNKHQQDAMDHTFYLSNVVPQNYENNAGFWNRFEMYCRDLSTKYSNVWVVSGPLMMSTLDEDGNRFVKYQVIGDSEVAVPTHLYKVVTVSQPDSDQLAMAAFIVPNEPLSFDYTLKQFQVPLHKLESKTGIDFVSKVDRSHAADLCSVDGCEMMDRDQFQLYIICRKLQSANTLHRLEKVWSELESKGLKPDKYATDLYNKKLKVFGEDNNTTED